MKFEEERASFVKMLGEMQPQPDIEDLRTKADISKVSKQCINA